MVGFAIVISANPNEHIVLLAKIELQLRTSSNQKNRANSNRSDLLLIFGMISSRNFKKSKILRQLSSMYD